MGFNIYFPYSGIYFIHYLGFAADKIGLLQAIPVLIALIAALVIFKHINKGKFVLVSLLCVASGLAGSVLMFGLMPGTVDTTLVFDIRLSTGLFLLSFSGIIMLMSAKIWTEKLYPQAIQGKYEFFCGIFYVLIPVVIACVISCVIIKTNGYIIMDYMVSKKGYIPDGKIFLAGGIASSLSIIPMLISRLVSSSPEKKKK